jgi:predicted DNA-binding transcriptional regulator AlpA
MSDAEASAFLGLRRTTLEHWRSGKKAGGPPYYKLGRRVVYRLADLEEWLASHRIAVA